MKELIVNQRIDHEMLKTQFGNMIRVGPVVQVDKVKGYRIDLATDADEPFLSPWLPFPESGGQTKTWIPLSVGQVVGILSANGDLRRGVLLRGGFTDENEQPSEDVEANVITAFGITVTMKDGTIYVEGNVDIVGDVKIKGNVEIEGDFLVKGNVDFAEGHVQHNGTNIGDDHVHGGVVPGAADTQGPH